MSTLPPEVGDYTIHYNVYLGHGSFGSVCTATHTDGTQVAVKRVTPQRQSGGYNWKLIDREVDVLQIINHPNITRFIHHDKVDDNVFIFLELCDCNLGKYAEQHEIVQPQKLSFMRDMSQGVLHLHLKRIIHRDLKPENLLVKRIAETPVLKVSDYGLSRFVPDDGTSSFAGTRGIGSKPWMAPEVFDSSIGNYKKKVDVFAEGVIFHSVINHTQRGDLEILTEGGLYLCEWITERRRRGEAIHMPEITVPHNIVARQAIKELIERMIHPDPSQRCDMKHVCDEVDRIISVSGGERDAGPGTPDAGAEGGVTASADEPDEGAQGGVDVRSEDIGHDDLMSAVAGEDVSQYQEQRPSPALPQCPECPLIFEAETTEHMFVEHLQSHYGISCPVCSEMFPSTNVRDSELYQKHVQGHFD